MHRLYQQIAKLFGLSQRPAAPPPQSERALFLEQLYAEMVIPGALRTRYIAELPCAAGALHDFGDVGFPGVKSINGLIARQNADTCPDQPSGVVETRYATPAVLRVPA